MAHFCKIFSKPFKLPEYEIEVGSNDIHGSTGKPHIVVETDIVTLSYVVTSVLILQCVVVELYMQTHTDTHPILCVCASVTGVGRCVATGYEP